MSSILSTLIPTSSPVSSPDHSPQATPSPIQSATPKEQQYFDEVTLEELRLMVKDMVLTDEAAEALKIFEAIAEEGHRQAIQGGTEEGDHAEAARQAILEGLVEAQWEAEHQEQTRRAFKALAAADRVREAALALILFLMRAMICCSPSLCISFLTGTPPHENASTNTFPIPESPAFSTTYTHLLHLATLFPDLTYDAPSFIDRLDLPIVITKMELMSEGIVHYGHPAMALPVHPLPLLTDNTITAEKDFHDAIMSLE
ncbi:hypothetical protein EW146_g3810 [Bondarzewia mesenterica]|uniref:Uncharacterized protein n=1 Tax=Bondarzewia mesenterica TaxID=1095465 RepID=A0A4S4LYL5_9AGAM|nr:hypothetical protein EW146_g3810 [Bondarzewia mesenterica]